MHIKMTKCWELPCRGLASHPRLSRNSGRFCRPLHTTHGCTQDILRGTHNFRNPPAPHPSLPLLYSPKSEARLCSTPKVREMT